MEVSPKPGYFLPGLMQGYWTPAKSWESKDGTKWVQYGRDAGTEVVPMSKVFVRL